MTPQPIYLGDTLKKEPSGPITGQFVTVRGADYYQIANYDRMRPFFMSIVSASDHWMFISSNGALTAGRKNPEHALFPYYTDDKIHDSHDLTGSKTLLLADISGKTLLWEPFSDRYRGVYALQRNLYKSIYGDTLVFEEVNRDLALTFYYAWTHSEQFGFVKRSGLRNDASTPVSLRVLDGIQNLLPYGVNLAMQTERSTLVDAYKKNELQPDTGLGLFALSSILVDRPEPSEALKATTVWSEGLEGAGYLVSSLQLDRFRQGLPLKTETDVRAERGAYFVHAVLDLEPAQEHDWHLVAEINQGPAEVVALRQMLEENRGIRARLEQDIEQGRGRLKRIVAQADGLQRTEDRLTTARHFSNVLFNVMRGGVPDHNYSVGKADLLDFIRHHDAPVARWHQDFLDALPETLSIGALIDTAAGQQDPQLTRLCYEYLPLAFSRRHGDPSRPWNYFSIETRKEDGTPNLHYQGNWRDIFQNWEALSVAYPGFIESMICKFVNASTADGYNPYRITRDGIDWEVIDPADPWSYIGYWGDHQIIYLLKLLELSRAHHPGVLEAFLTQNLFAYANVPYRIKPYEALLRDPHDTIVFDDEEEARILERMQQVGADGKLVWNRAGAVYLVNLTEKLLVSLLAKLSNFIPEAGIWMNTQRPEWNDANNALVGYGVSMVTLYYLRRFLHFLTNLFGALDEAEIDVSEEVADWLEATTQAFAEGKPLLQVKKGSDYRETIYAQGFSEQRKRVRTADLLAFFEQSRALVDRTIQANQRADKLYHAYNLMSVDGAEAVSIHPLYEMLEGQVAVLSAGLLSAEASLEVLAALKTSALYREDQYSYLLYPDRRLPRFAEKNNIPPEKVTQSVLLQKLADAGDRHLVVKDARGGFHFNGTFRNAESVRAALDGLSEDGYTEEVAQDRTLVLDLFEDLFDHRSYTGRSGTFFGYEGLGSIYWHMVSKLLLAIKETYFRVLEEGASSAVLGELAASYYDVRAGIGFNKNPETYGAFPSDPYSHTPGNAGAQQPGMTGQVKEDILARWGELGVTVSQGRIVFQPVLLRKAEFLSRPGTFAYYDVVGHPQTLSLEANTLAFTYCQIPVVYRLSDRPNIEITHNDGRVEVLAGLELDAATSAKIFDRRGEIVTLEVALMPGL